MDVTNEATPSSSFPRRCRRCRRSARPSTRPACPPQTIELVHLRASQINGCSVCVEMHARDLKKAGESRRAALRALPPGARRPYFTDAERAALALTEAMTRLSDRSDAVPDDVWDDAAGHYDEQELAGADPLHRQRQPLEPPQRRDPPDGRHGLVTP